MQPIAKTSPKLEISVEANTRARPRNLKERTRKTRTSPTSFQMCAMMNPAHARPPQTPQRRHAAECIDIAPARPVIIKARRALILAVTVDSTNCDPLVWAHGAKVPIARIGVESRGHQIVLLKTHTPRDAREPPPCFQRRGWVRMIHHFDLAPWVYVRDPAPMCTTSS